MHNIDTTTIAPSTEASLLYGTSKIQGFSSDFKLGLAC